MKTLSVVTLFTIIMFPGAADAQRSLAGEQGSRSAKQQPHSAASTLSSGVPVSFTLPPVATSTLFYGDYSFSINVPSGLTSDARLEVRLSTATPGADVDMYVRFGQDVALSGGRPVTDYLSETAGGNEAITIGAPALRPGVWYIAFGVFSTGVRVDSTITATLITGSATPAPKPTTLPDNALTVSQFVAGGGWTTSLFVTNISATAEKFTLRFFGGDGSARRMPLVQPGTVDTITGSIASGETLVFDTTDAGALLDGWALLTPATPGTARLSGFAVLRHRTPGQPDAEAVAPFVSIAERRYIFLFDNANGFETGVALVNPNPSAPLTIFATVRNQSGQTISTDTLTLPPFGHTAFAMSQMFPSSANRRGSLQLVASPSGVTGMGLRFSPNGAFTSFPALTSADIQP